MSECSNCYGGCTDIVSDQCVKYTGVSIPILGIETGDSLSYVEQALVEFLVSTLDGTGIKIDIDPTIICTLVQTYLPTCGDITIVDLINTLIKSVCDLQEQITNVAEDIATIEANYTISCLSGITVSSGTHAIVQAIITKLCAQDVILTAFALNLVTNYVQLLELNSLIDAHLVDTSTLMSNKMVPYVAVEYYGPLGYFDVTGAGTGNWLNIYLCNGNNGTPDKRGRIPIGTTTGIGGPAFAPAVDPAITGNPSYSLYTVGGTNNVVLSASQIPSHTHTATSIVTELPHFHYEFNTDIGTSSSLSIDSITYPNYFTGNNAWTYDIKGSTTPAIVGKSSLASTGLTVATTITAIGGNLSHSNIQPVLACHYLIFIP